VADKSKIRAQGKPPTKPGREAASGDAPARAKGQVGNAGYAGYEYQIEVTIWIALDLILAKAATSELTIEPPSHEDLEAAVQDPDEALLGLAAEGDRVDFIFQAKTRSASPWSSADLAKVLTGEQDKEGTKGRGRSRPLEMLMADQRRRYVFITNEALTGPLRANEAQHFFDFPEATELPPYAREGYDAPAQAELAPRILLCSGVSEEVMIGVSSPQSPGAGPGRGRSGAGGSHLAGAVAAASLDRRRD
jgi:hypothetical protein